MGLFNRNKDRDLSAGLGKVWATEPEPVVEYNTVVEWLNGLSDEDYKKVCSVVQIYRQADVKVAKELGIENAPTTFIYPPEPPTLVDSTFTDDDGRFNLLDDEDTSIGNFLEDELPPKTAKSKAKKAAKK